MPRGDYEQAQLDFHRSLHHRRPVGLLGSALFSAAELPWLGDGSPGYEDWYLVEDFAALGVLNEAAVGRGHRSSHERAAQHVASGAAGLYGLHEGTHDEILGHSLGEAIVAVWVARAPGSAEPALAGMLGDGVDRGHASVWRRRMVLGPAPEFCVLADHVPRGAGDSRLPRGWTATTISREVLWQG